MLRDCDAARWRLLSRGDLSAHEPERDHRMRGQPWTAGQGGRGVGGIATLPSLGELKVRLLLLGHQLKIS
jgi:hypothetical protein